jgi:hypothetical protein
MNLLSACLHKKNTAILTPIRLQTTPSCEEKSEPLYAEIKTENQYPCGTKRNSKNQTSTAKVMSSFLLKLKIQC